jgi:glycerol uptake facilitator protein
MIIAAQSWCLDCERSSDFNFLLHRFPKNMNVYLAEFIGTAMLVLFGDGVVANVLLGKSKGQGGGWIVIATGWGLAVTMAVYSVGTISGAHLNPAVTIGLAVIGKFSLAKVAGYIVAQIAGAMFGAFLVWLAYLPHWKETPDTGAKLAVFCTGPAIRSTPCNLICEAIGAGTLVFGVLAIPSSANLSGPGWATGFGPLIVGLLVFAIGLSLGGPTGYAINPARDFGPRLTHAILPIFGKGGSDWRYAWIPVFGPILGGIFGAWAYGLLYA